MVDRPRVCVSRRALQRDRPRFGEDSARQRNDPETGRSTALRSAAGERSRKARRRLTHGADGSAGGHRCACCLPRERRRQVHQRDAHSG